MMNNIKNYAIYLITVAVLAMAGCTDDLDKNKFKYEVKPLAVSGMKLNKNETTLRWNTRETLVVTITPALAANKVVSWTSSDANIATVNSNGEVLGVEVGKATITATTDDGGKTDFCEVTVEPFVELDVTTLSLLVGDTYTFTAAVRPSTYPQTITWSSTTADVVTVTTDGEITAVKNGSSNIRATVEGGFRASCAVNVGNVPVQSIELDEENIALPFGETTTLTATVLPGNAANHNLIWSVSGNGVSLHANDHVATLTRVGSGEVIVTVTTEDGGFKASCKVLEKPFYPNELEPFSATLNDNFEYGDGYSGMIRAGTVLFDQEDDGNIPKGTIFEFDMEFTASRDFEDEELYAAIVDSREVAGWWTVKGETKTKGELIKAGESVSLIITIEITEATSRTTCDLHFETAGEGIPGTADSGIIGPVTLNFTKFILNKK